jgi:PAS domain-containing protein
MQKTNFRAQFTNAADACALAQSIVDTVREPVVVLDRALRVIAASRSFYSAFKVSPEETQGKLLYALGGGQWDIPKLRVLLLHFRDVRSLSFGSQLPTYRCDALGAARGHFETHSLQHECIQKDRLARWPSRNSTSDLIRRQR